MYIEQKSYDNFGMGLKVQGLANYLHFVQKRSFAN
jgi:hypothetical protein